MAERPLPYDGEEPYVFVSYSHADDGIVYPEIRWLQDQGFNVWYDEGISGASRWRDAIAGRLGGCHLLLFFVSPSSVQSQVCREELEFVLDLDRPVLSVHLEPTPLPDGIKLAIVNRQALFRFELEPDDYKRKLLSAIATYLDQPLPVIEPGGVPVRKSSKQTSWNTAVACALILSGIAVLVTWFILRPESPTPGALVRFPIDLPSGITLPTTNVGRLFAVSRDGSRVVFNGASEDGSRRLWVRSLGELDAAPISGVEGNLGSLYFSPDGEWVVFDDRDAGAIKKVHVSGGSPVTITEKRPQEGLMGLSWGTDGTIIFATLANPGLMRVSASGGMPGTLTDPPAGVRHWSPYFLADRGAVLFTVNSDNPAQIAVRSLESGEERSLVEGANPRITSSGHLLFTRAGSVWAMEFSTDRLQVSGTAIRVHEHVAHPFPGFDQLSTTDDGSMVYLPAVLERSDTLVWVDHDGVETPLAISAGHYLQPRVSPDGRHVAVSMSEGLAGEYDVLIHSLDDDRVTKLTIEEGSHTGILWSLDGKRILYSTRYGERAGGGNLHWRNSDGTGEIQSLGSNSLYQVPNSWTGDGQQAMYYQCEAGFAGCDLGRLTLSNEPATELFLATEADERNPSLSPDGRWVAYESDVSGAEEIYVRPYPGIDSGLWQISADGGEQPLWSPDGSTLYYTANFYSSFQGGGQMMAVPIETEQGFRAGRAEVIFDLTPYRPSFGRSYALDPDGERFLMVKQGDLPDKSPQRLILVQNWLEEVKRLVPTD